MQPKIEANLDPMAIEHLHDGHGTQAGDAPEDGAALAAEFLPTPDDPRILLTLAARSREPVQTLWALALRLTKLLDDVREPMIGQIKLAWWRDMMAMLATKPDALPKGEPLLADFQAHFQGVSNLVDLVDAAEAMLLAEELAEREMAATSFGQTLFSLSIGCSRYAPHTAQAAQIKQAETRIGHAWGLLWGAYVQRGTADGTAMLAAAGLCPKLSPAHYGAGQRAWLMIDRLARQIGTAQGGRDLRREGLLMLRIGLFGR